MTEERMIRVNDEMFFIEGYYDGRLIPSSLDYIRWKHLELAPPKDWRPLCFEPKDNERTINTCKRTVTPEGMYFGECDGCPFRKKD